MTNNKKERLKNLVKEMQECFLYKIVSPTKERIKIGKDCEAILSLIDRQPTEDQALDMMHDIEWFMSNCIHHSGLSEFSKCEDCFNFGSCGLKKKTIRKALGVEEE